MYVDPPPASTLRTNQMSLSPDKSTTSPKRACQFEFPVVREPPPVGIIEIGALDESCDESWTGTHRHNLSPGQDQDNAADMGQIGLCRVLPCPSPAKPSSAQTNPATVTILFYSILLFSPISVTAMHGRSVECTKRGHAPVTPGPILPWCCRSQAIMTRFNACTSTVPHCQPPRGGSGHANSIRFRMCLRANDNSSTMTSCSMSIYFDA